MNIKGLVELKEGDSIGITCCHTVPNIRVGGVELYAWLKEKSRLPELESQEDGSPPPAPQIEWSVRYCVQDTPFTEEYFNVAAANIVTSMLYSEEVRGCYSEWTCGLGDYDFLIGKDRKGHSILTELASHVGKHVWVEFN